MGAERKECFGTLFHFAGKDGCLLTKENKEKLEEKKGTKIRVKVSVCLLITGLQICRQHIHVAHISCEVTPLFQCLCVVCVCACVYACVPVCMHVVSVCVYENRIL